MIVTDDTPTVNVEAGGNANAIVLKGKDLDALSDDPDELSNELQALAGPSAGPNGGQIYIDGFTGGQLAAQVRHPRNSHQPESLLRRVSTASATAASRSSPSPAPTSCTASFLRMGNDNALQHRQPIHKPNHNPIPPYHSIQFNGTVSGPLSKWASFFVSVQQRNNQNDSVYSLAQAAVLASDPTQPCGAGITGTCEIGPVSGGLFAPQTRTNIAPRIDLQLGQKHTLTARYQFYRNNQSGRIGSTSLPSSLLIHLKPKAPFS